MTKINKEKNDIELPLLSKSNSNNKSALSIKPVPYSRLSESSTKPKYFDFSAINFLLFTWITAIVEVRFTTNIQAYFLNLYRKVIRPPSNKITITTYVIPRMPNISLMSSTLSGLKIKTNLSLYSALIMALSRNISGYLNF